MPGFFVTQFLENLVGGTINLQPDMNLLERKQIKPGFGFLARFLTSLSNSFYHRLASAGAPKGMLGLRVLSFLA